MTNKRFKITHYLYTWIWQRNTGKLGMTGQPYADLALVFWFFCFFFQTSKLERKLVECFGHFSKIVLMKSASVGKNKIVHCNLKMIETVEHLLFFWLFIYRVNSLDLF